MRYLALGLSLGLIACAPASAPAPAKGPPAGPALERDAATPAPHVDASVTPDAARVDAPLADGAPSVDVAAPPAPSGDWWDSHWSKRARLTVVDSALMGPLTDFQIPVKLDATTIDYASTQAMGADLRVVTADGQVLAHQIDSWDPAGASLLWVKLPTLSAQPPSLWIYYGNPAAPALSAANASAVWPAPYAGVWHLSGDAKDATANGFDGVTMAGGSFVDAQMGKGLMLDRAGKEHIALKADIKVLARAAGCTFSAWINPVNVEDSVNGMIIMTLGKWFNDNHNSYADFNVNAAGSMISHIDPGTNTAASGYARVVSNPGFIKAGEWAFVTYVIDLASNEERFFKNGQLVDTKPPPGGKFSAPAFIDMVSTRVIIGSEEDNVSHWWSGRMDELRIETALRPPAWIAAQYRAMTVPGFATVTRAP